MSSLRPVSGSPREILQLLRQWDQAADPSPLVVATSGSTGHPKRVLLSRAAMRASALATLDRLGGPGRWLLTLPPTYVAGLQVLFRCVVAGTEPLVADESRSSARAGTSGRSYVSVVPTQLVRALHDEGDRARGELDLATLAGFDAVLVGGAALDRRVRLAAEAAGVRVVTTYGMSETCGGCVYDGVPLDGVEVGVEDGRVRLRGPVLFDGYEGDPELTAAAYCDGWLVTHDLGHLADGVLAIDGRDDDVLVSGGVNVPASAVAAAVSAHPAVVGVEVVGVPDHEWGERVVAVVAARDPISLDSVRALVRPRAWAPRQLVVVDAIPLLPNGKPDRKRLRELAVAGAG